VIVADASAVLDVLLQAPKAPWIAQHLFAPGQSVQVPHVIDLEVLQVLRRYSRTADMGAVHAEQALQVFWSMPLNRYPHTVLAPRIWELRYSFTAYDAAYIALAEALDCPLMTCDRALGSGHQAKVIVV
jgi:predicted nucleic acid-binding protein